MNNTIQIKFTIVLNLCVLLLISACSKPPVELVKQENLDIVVYASGEFESKEFAIIAPPSVRSMWQYQIKSLAPENKQATKGQVLVSFDNKKVSEKLVDKQAQLDQAQKELDNKVLTEKATEQELILSIAEKQMEFEKAKRRADIIDNSRSENDRKKSEIDFTVAENDLFLANEKLKFHHNSKLLNLKRAKGKVSRLTVTTSELKKDLDRLNVKAPIDGMVIYKINSEGEKPAVGENIRFGQPLIELAVIEKMQLKAQIAEPDSGKVIVGQKVKIIIDGNQEIALQGKVESLGRVFRDKSYQDKRRIFDAIIALEIDEKTVIRPGMTARVEIVTQTLNDVLTIPSSLVNNVNGEYTVATPSLWGVANKAISISASVNNKVIIESGLAVNDEVIR